MGYMMKLVRWNFGSVVNFGDFQLSRRSGTNHPPKQNNTTLTTHPFQRILSRYPWNESKTQTVFLSEHLVAKDTFSSAWKYFTSVTILDKHHSNQHLWSGWRSILAVGRLHDIRRHAF
jgi:hypothetical protein